MSRDAFGQAAEAPSMPTCRPGGAGRPTLVIGLGNPMLGDDGVGWRIAQEVERRLRASDPGAPDDPPSALNPQLSSVPAEVDCAALGGLSLMERMIGYERVLLTDAVITGRHPIGHVLTLTLEDLISGVSGHSGSTHDVSLATALEIGSTMGAELPEELLIVGIETSPNFEFGEVLSPPVNAALPLAVEAALATLARWGVPVTGVSD